MISVSVKRVRYDGGGDEIVVGGLVHGTSVALSLQAAEELRMELGRVMKSRIRPKRPVPHVDQVIDASALSALCRRRKPVRVSVLGGTFPWKSEPEKCAESMAAMASMWASRFLVRLPSMSYSRLREFFGPTPDAWTSLLRDDAHVGVINFVNGWSRWRHMPEDGNPLDGSVPRWPLPNVALVASMFTVFEHNLNMLDELTCALRVLHVNTDHLHLWGHRSSDFIRILRKSRIGWVINDSSNVTGMSVEAACRRAKVPCFNTFLGKDGTQLMQYPDGWRLGDDPQ